MKKLILSLSLLYANIAIGQVEIAGYGNDSIRFKLNNEFLEKWNVIYEKNGSKYVIYEHDSIFLVMDKKDNHDIFKGDFKKSFGKQFARPKDPSLGNEVAIIYFMVDSDGLIKSRGFIKPTRSEKINNQIDNVLKGYARKNFSSYILNGERVSSILFITIDFSDYTIWE